MTQLHERCIEYRDKIRCPHQQLNRADVVPFPSIWTAHARRNERSVMGLEIRLRGSTPLDKPSQPHVDGHVRRLTFIGTGDRYTNGVPERESTFREADF